MVLPIRLGGLAEHGIPQHFLYVPDAVNPAIFGRLIAH